MDQERMIIVGASVFFGAIVVFVLGRIRKSRAKKANSGGGGGGGRPRPDTHPK